MTAGARAAAIRAWMEAAGGTLAGLADELPDDPELPDFSVALEGATDEDQAAGQLTETLALLSRQMREAIGDGAREAAAKAALRAGLADVEANCGPDEFLAERGVAHEALAFLALQRDDFAGLARELAAADALLGEAVPDGALWPNRVALEAAVLEALGGGEADKALARAELLVRRTAAAVAIDRRHSRWQNAQASLLLACYPRHLLVELTARDAGGPLAAAALYGPSGLRVITGHSAVLHLLNEEGWLTLETEAQARDYLRLFVSVVHADRGRFELIEAAGGLPEAARALMAAAGQPADGRLTMTREGGPWVAEGLMRYGDVLARAQFAISAGGLVEMVDDMPPGVIPELAVERFETPFRGLSAAAGSAP